MTWFSKLLAISNKHDVTLDFTVPFVIHLALSISKPASRTHIVNAITGAYSWLLHVMHIWYQWLESVKTSDINVYPNRQKYGPFTLPTKTVLNALLVAATKWDINLSHSWWNYNWKTMATTDNLHHHRSMQVKRDDHTFSSKTVWNQRYTPKIKNLGIISYT